MQTNFGFDIIDLAQSLFINILQSVSIFALQSLYVVST